MSAAILSIANYKGGVGKTTTAVNLAGCLASLGHKTLLIDLDGQANATGYLLGFLHDQAFYPIRKAKRTLPYLIDEIVKGEALNLEHWIRKDFIRRREQGVLPQLHLIPGDSGLLRREAILREKKDLLRDWLRERLAPLYDFIVIDCPPSLGPASISALRASDYYIVPAIPDAMSFMGIPTLISRLSGDLADISESEDIPEFLGILYTRIVARRGRVQQKYENLIHSAFANGKFKRYGIPAGDHYFFEAKIPDHIDVPDSVADLQPLCVYKPNCDSARQYLAFTQEVLKKIKDGGHVAA